MNQQLRAIWSDSLRRLVPTTALLPIMLVGQNRLKSLSVGFLLGTALAILAAGCGDGPSPIEPITISGQTMGTLYTVKIVSQDAMTAEEFAALSDSITTVLDEVNSQMSAYDSLSEISEFNRLRDTAWFAVSPALAMIVDNSLKICRESSGAFDITVAPLVNLWGFGPENVPRVVPATSTIDSILEETGYGYLEVRHSPPALRKLKGEISCDLAAVAKGYGVDCVAECLNRQGISNHLVEIGGEIRATGSNPDGESWRVGIKSPDSSTSIQRAISLTELAMATSGTYLNYFELNGVRYTHLVDPRTGYPVQQHLVSVTVLHESCLYADAMATAIIVAGAEEGLELATRMNLAVLLIIEEDGQLKQVATPEFEKLVLDRT